MNAPLSKTSFIGSLLMQGAIVLVNILVAFGIEMTTERLSAITSTVAFISIIVTIILWAMTVPKEKVLEMLIGDHVVAGPANDIKPEGATIRTIGSGAQEVN